MMKGYLTANDLRIAYYIYNLEKENTIFFIHGNSSGNSDEIELAANADFSLPAIGKIIAQALGQLLNGNAYIICSVSLGTNLVAEMLAHNLSPDGLVLAASCIVGKWRRAYLI